MELLLTDEQTMLRDSAATFAERRGGAGALRATRAAEAKLDREMWRAAADAGWLAVLAAEEDGGLGLGLTELCLISQEFGKSLVAIPVAAVAATARALGSSPLAAGVLAGDFVILPALAESARAIGDEPPGVTAAIDGDSAILDGTKTGVGFPSDADAFLVSAVSPDGVVLASVGRDAVQIDAAPAMDGGQTGSIDLDSARATLVAGPNEAPAAIASLLDALHLATAAELLGVMEAAQAITVDYLKIREQFDRPIGSFQALQHRAVDNLAAIEMCRSLTYQAASAIGARGESEGLASAALSLAARNALTVAKAAIQMHGGIGFTDEHDIGLYLKRAMTLTARFGNAGMHRKRYAQTAEQHD